MWCMRITVSAFTRGLRRLRSDKIAKDYMKISYAAGGNLYIPATQLDLIQKYASADAQEAEAESVLARRTGPERENSVKSAVQLIAKDLVKLYAARQEQEGYRIWRGYRMAAGI